MTQADQVDRRDLRFEQQGSEIASQLARAFPLPPSGSFGDLLCAIDRMEQRPDSSLDQPQHHKRPPVRS
jgi:hypothetical protein